MKKKFLLLPLIGGFLLTGCKIDLFGHTFYLFEDAPQEGGDKTDDSSSDTDTEVKQHATKLDIDPKKPFYLKVGEVKEISVKHDPAPTDRSEIETTFSLTGDSVRYEVNEEKTSKSKSTIYLNVTGEKAGTSVLRAVCNYNQSLFGSFTFNVIEFDEKTDYLWQYSSADRSQFGYVANDAPAGTDEGDAILAGTSWHYKRLPEVSSLRSDKEALAFGKGEAPETSITLESENERVVNSIKIESASAHGLAHLKVSVGEVTYIDDDVPFPSNDIMNLLESNVLEPVSGNIKIEFTTPAYDKAQAATNPDYIAPGATYLKSIYIDYDGALPDKTISLVKNSDDIVQGGRYIILGHSDIGYGLLDGSISTSVKETPKMLTDFTFADEVTVAGDFTQYGFVASISDEKLDFTSDLGIKIGLTQKGSLSTTNKPDLLGWTYSIGSSNELIMSMLDQEDDPKTKYFGVNKSTNKFSSYANKTGSSQGAVYLYKF